MEKIGNARHQINRGSLRILRGKTARRRSESIFNILKEVQSNNIELTEPVKKLFVSIKKINLTLWNVEDKLRVCEKNKDFSQTFINLARDVYFNNDQRAKIKSQINTILGSNIKEIKQYSDY